MMVEGLVTNPRVVWERFLAWLRSPKYAKKWKDENNGKT